MRTSFTLTLLGALALLGVASVTAQDSPTFEVASIRKNPKEISGVLEALRQIRTLPGGRFEASTQLRNLIYWAWALKPYQRVEGSATILDERFDIVAKAPTDARLPGPGESSPFKQMLQALLIERFKLKVRIQEEMQPAMVLRRVSGEKLGPGLRPTSFACPSGPVPPQGTSEADAWRRCHAGVINGLYDGVVPNMAAFAEFLSKGQRVIDDTGLRGVYEIRTTFDFLPLMPAQLRFEGSSRDLPSFAQAMRDDLGLRVDTERRPVQIVVVEHVEEPTEN